MELYYQKKYLDIGKIEKRSLILLQNLLWINEKCQEHIEITD